MYGFVLSELAELLGLGGAVRKTQAFFGLMCGYTPTWDY